MTSRYIPKKIRREVEGKFAFGRGLKCGFPKCWNPARNWHHTKRFAIVKRHLAEEIVPLCKIHHELAHAGAIENEELLAKGGDMLLETWRLNLDARKDSAVAEVDKIVQRKKRHRERGRPWGINRF